MNSQNRPLLGNMHYFSQALLLIGLVLVSGALFFMLGVALAKPFFGISFLAQTDVMSNLDKPNVLNSLKLLQILNTLGTFVLPPFLFAFLIERRVSTYLLLNRFPRLPSFIFTIIIMFAAIPLINWMGELNSMMKLPEALSDLEKWMKDAETKAARLTQVLLNMNSTGELVVNFLMVAILPALGEELLFRGCILKIIKGWTKNAHAAIWITAIIFSAMHMQFYGFIPRMMMGVFFGYLLVWSRSLWLPICAHFVNNGAAVVFAYFNKKDVLSIDPDKLGIGDGSSLTIIFSVAIVFILIFLIRKVEIKSNEFLLV